MACPDNNPCNQTNPCDPCNEYDNCGCINPTTFGCVTSSVSVPSLGVTAGENGDDILKKIGIKLEDSGKVRLDASDTCAEFLTEKVAAGVNISFSFTGEGCDRKLVIHSTTGGAVPDINVRASANDNTSGYLFDKIDGGIFIKKNILNAGSNEKVQLQLDIDQVISQDAGNQLTKGGDGRLKTSYTAPDGTETIVTGGAGVNVLGAGSQDNPYVISTNASIYAIRPCFDSVWRNVVVLASGNPAVVWNSGNPQYRYRHDGTVEFKGQITYTVAFGSYTAGPRRFVIPMGNIPVTCLNAGELGSAADLKGVMYIADFQASADQITQQFGYIIRKSAQNLVLEFQSSFTNPTSKTIIVNFEGVVIHPNI